ncbi:MAG: hypothetical protein ACREXW_16285 [Gammaproteobacteria bacterium]
MEAHEAAEVFHRLDQRQRAGAVIDVAAGVVLRTGGDEQDADGRGDDRNVERPRIRQASADAHGFPSLEQESVAVVEQLPRQTEQERGSFAGGIRLSLGCAGFERGIHVDGETAAGMTVAIRAQAFMTFAVCAPGSAAACRSCPHFTRLSSTFRARSRKYSLGQMAYFSRYQRRSSASIGPSGATNRQLCALATSRCPGAAGS